MMKATLGMNYRMLSSNIEDMSNKMYDLREQSATGKKMNKPSDNPGAIKPLLDYRLKMTSTERYIEHIGEAKGEMNILDSNLDQVENIMVAAKEAGIAVVNGSLGDADRQTYADKIAHMFDEMMQMANTQNNGKYLYSGYQESTAPFSENVNYSADAYDPDNAATWAVNYHGDSNAKQVEIGPDKQIQAAVTGNELFLGDADNNGEVDAGGTDLFSTLKNLENAIRSNDAGAMQDGLDELERGADQVRRVRGQMGNNTARIERADTYMTEASLEFQEVISGYEDADVLEVFSELLQHETAFKAALNVTTRVSKLSILNYM